MNEFHYKMSEKFSELHPDFFVVFMNLLKLLQFTLNVSKFDLHFNGFTWHEMTLLVRYRFTCTHPMLYVHLQKISMRFYTLTLVCIS
jgi:hypothetical protein